MSYVYDIRSISLTNLNLNTRVFIDANVLFWTFYSRQGLSPRPIAPHQIIYPTFLGDLYLANIELHVAAFTLSEVMHIIEKTEYDIHCINGGVKNKKLFRKNERANVFTHIDLAFRCIQNIITGQIDESLYTDQVVNDYVNNFNIHLFELPDFILAQKAKSESCAILTDDVDFSCGFHNCDLFTANNTLISNAVSKGYILVS